MSDSKIRSVQRTYIKGDETVVVYDDGTQITTYSMGSSVAATKPGLKVTGSKKPKTSSSSSHGGSGNWDQTYKPNVPTLAFEAYGIQFWGSSKYKLDDIPFEEGDLIINCTGTSWKPKAPPVPKIFAKESPDWLTLPDILVTPTKDYNNGDLAEQLLLDWPDMKPPPEDAGLEFWISILDQAVKNNIKRIFVCCQAGQGRTGTALSSFLLATGAVDEPDLAIDYIREEYNVKAVETKGQEEYVFGLIYE